MNLSMAAQLRPVGFWIHGGAFETGTGADPTFAGSNMASRGDVVIVTINYRLSTLGFLALDDGVTNGNFGIANMVAALEWVRAHITAFGGDPDHITIAGQSVGSGAVRELLGSPRVFFARILNDPNITFPQACSRCILYLQKGDMIIVRVFPEQITRQMELFGATT